MTIKQNGGIFGRKPTFSTLDVDSSETGTALTVTSSSSGHNIDMVDSTATARIRNVSGRLHITADVNDESASSAIRFYVDNNRKVDIDSSGNIVFDGSGQGIDFSATSGTGTSELFDDYEEGTWTPDVQDTSGNSASTSSASGTYTKVGDLVTAFMRIVDVNKSGLTAGDAIRVYGLPYTGGGTTRYGGSAIINTWTGTTGLITQVIGGNTYAQFKTSSNGNALVSEITSGSADIYAQVTYKV